MANDESGSQESEESTEESTEGATGEQANAAAETESDAGEESFAPDELEDSAPQVTAPPADVNLDLVLEVPVNVSLQVGSTDITIRDLVQLVEGSVVALDRESTEPLDVLVNGTLIAHGEIVVVDGAFGVRLTDVVSPAERIRNIN